MLNSKGERELAYVTRINEIRPIEGADKVELAIVGGWQVMVRKNQFKVGDPAIYFEIDSKVPETEPFKFLESKHYKIKTQKYFKGTVLSQGLLMSASDFNWKIEYDSQDSSEDVPFIIDDKNNYHYAGGESRFLTKELNVKYAVEEDNTRKANSIDKYKKMAARHPELFKKAPIRWLMQRTWGKKLLFICFGKKRDKTGWPAWVEKTDEERCQNLTGLLFNDGPWSKEDWIATEKIDGSSTTFTLKRGRPFKKNEFYVCSRNVVFDKPDKKCFYPSNIYLEMAEKYQIKEKMERMLEMFPQAQWVTIQGETYGEGVQKRDYSIKGHDFKAFNLIFSDTGRWNSMNMKAWLESIFHIPCIHIIEEHYHLPDTIEELLDYATGISSIDGKEREGVVFRSQDGKKSFKAVSNDFLIKYHQ